MTTPGEPLVELRGVRFSHGPDFTLHVPEFRISPGERAAMIGPSGSGKSTLLDLIAGIRLADEGVVRFMGRDWRSMPERERRKVRLARIGLAFQEFELLDYLPAADNIALACFVAGLPSGDAARRRDELARAAGITHVLSRRPGSISQGERQRVAVCRALITRPPLILGDEPTGNLDPASSRAVIGMLLDQARADGAALVLATHDHAVLDRFDRVIDLRRWGPRA